MAVADRDGAAALEAGRGLSRWASRGLAIVVLSILAYLLHRIFSNHPPAEILAAAVAVPLHRVSLAAGFAAASYFCLTLFDLLALRSIGSRIGYGRAALASFTALSIGHNLGFAAASSGAVRYRFYAGWGLSAGEVAKVILFCAITVGLGLAGLGGLALLLHPDLARAVTGFGDPTRLALGAACLTLPAFYVALSAIGVRPIAIRRWTLALPPWPIALAQAAIGPVNFACVAACLHQTIAGVADLPYLQVAAAYVIANVASLLAHVPGGLGVIESVVMHLLPGAGLIGALLLFRAVYFFLPLPIGAALFTLAELSGDRRRPRTAAAAQEP